MRLVININNVTIFLKVQSRAQLTPFFRFPSLPSWSVSLSCLLARSMLVYLSIYLYLFSPIYSSTLPRSFLESDEEEEEDDDDDNDKSHVDSAVQVGFSF